MNIMTRPSGLIVATDKPPPLAPGLVHAVRPDPPNRNGYCPDCGGLTVPGIHRGYSYKLWCEHCRKDPSDWLPSPGSPFSF